MKLADPLSHYRLDAEYFDYFETPNRIDGDCARRIREAIAVAMKGRNEGWILDVGSGNGWVQQQYAKSPRSVVSLDLGRRNLQRIRKNLPEALCVVADAARLPFRSGVFSVVIASEVLEHLNDPGKMLAEAREIVKDEGVIIVSTPYKEKLKYALCIHCNQPTPHNAHIHSFDEESLANLMTGRGFGAQTQSVFLSKVFTRSRLSFLFRFLSYRMWRWMDDLFVFIFRDAQTLLITAATNPMKNR